MKLVSLVASLALLLGVSATVRAQDVPGPGYVHITAGLITQPDAMPNHRIRPPLGGAGFPTVAAAGGYFIRPSLAIEGELATSEVTVDQTFSYNWREEYTAAVDVLSINACARWKPGGWSPVELVMGGGLARVRHETRDGVRIDSYIGPPTRTEMIDSGSSDFLLNVKGGADVVYPRASRTAFVAGARLRWRQRNTGDDYRGVSAWAFDLGAGLRVRF